MFRLRWLMPWRRLFSNFIADWTISDARVHTWFTSDAKLYIWTISDEIRGQAMTHYQVGDRPRLTGNLALADGSPVDPTAVFGWFCPPDGPVTIYHYSVDAALLRDSVGQYHMDIDITTYGHWHYGFYSTGTGKAASADGRLVVDQSERG